MFADIWWRTDYNTKHSSSVATKFWSFISAAWNVHSKPQTLMPAELNQWARSKLISWSQYVTIIQREFIIEEVDVIISLTVAPKYQNPKQPCALINEQSEQEPSRLFSGCCFQVSLWNTRSVNWAHQKVLPKITPGIIWKSPIDNAIILQTIHSGDSYRLKRIFASKFHIKLQIFYHKCKCSSIGICTSSLFTLLCLSLSLS